MSEYDQVFVYGMDKDHGQYGRIVKSFPPRPGHNGRDYAFLAEGQVDKGFYLWIRREDFEYVKGRLSSWATLEMIEQALDKPNHLEMIRDILDQYHQGKV